MTYLDPKIWGPHYWFFIHTVAMTYPIRPNAVTKKKYYEFIQNLPLFIPIENISAMSVKIIPKFVLNEGIETDINSNIYIN